MLEFILHPWRQRALLIWFIIGIASPVAGQDLSALGGASESLEQVLLREDAGRLAEEAGQSGDGARGAVLFYQSHLACTKCHTAGDGTAWGPDLIKIEPKLSGAQLVESLLSPSKVIKQGFASVTLLDDAGQTITGLLVEELPDKLGLRDAAQGFRRIDISKSRIVQRRTGDVSLMPTGLVNQLSSRQQFLDLIRYLTEIAEQGPERARALRPAAALLAPPPVPEYEKHLDHAGFVRSLDENAFRRGEAIYQRLCINCHGTHDQPGSLPTSLRFSSGKFKNGSDPYRIYQTLTNGFGLMAAQHWMVPEQKYDVIHFIREAYLKRHNSSQYVPIDDTYLAGLPPGTERGPQATLLTPWSTMDYGPALGLTLEAGNDHSNLAYKGLAVRLDPGPGGVARGKYWMLYEHDTLRVAAGWSGNQFIDWKGINFDGAHQIHPHVAGTVHFANPDGPGWARPGTGRFDDPRMIGRDGRRYGPLPRDWAHLRGVHQAGSRVVLSYTVGSCDVLESPGVEFTGDAADTMIRTPIFTRSLRLGPRSSDLILQVAQQSTHDVELVEMPAKDDVVGVIVRPMATAKPPAANEGHTLVAGVRCTSAACQWLLPSAGRLCLRIPAGQQPLSLVVWTATVANSTAATQLTAELPPTLVPLDLISLTRGNPRRWTETLTTIPVLGDDSGPFAIDSLTPPVNNPWNCQMRFTGLDFFPGRDQLAVCSWDGDVWLVSGMLDPKKGLTWQRFASGLFQPLGLKIANGKVYVGCRDQIAILHDRNGDGEADYYENFNSDHQVTEHFHEFAMGLQTDSQGSFYYAKSARHALTAVVPHHGTLLRVSQDGSRTDILANGFRAANGVCLNPDGTFVVTDQEGHWNPKNRINWVVPPKAGQQPRFYGNMFGYHDVTDASDAAMEQPLCWITNALDRSPSELLWVESPRWGRLRGSLLNLSYGYGKVFVVPHESVAGQVQGGMCELPIPAFPTGVMRGRFHPADGQLYLCGMFAWAGNATQPGGLYRLRYTGKPVYVPIGLAAHARGLTLKFSGPLDPASVGDVDKYAIKTWSLKRSANYGSENADERLLKVTEAKLSSDGSELQLTIPEIRPTWCMEIKYELTSVDGQAVRGTIHNTVHHLGE